MIPYDPSTIVVYHGVITTIGVIEPLLESGDEVKLATKEEIDLYNKRPEK